MYAREIIIIILSDKPCMLNPSIYGFSRLDLPILKLTLLKLKYNKKLYFKSALITALPMKYFPPTQPLVECMTCILSFCWQDFYPLTYQ